MTFAATVKTLADQIDAACDRGDDCQANLLLRLLANHVVNRLWDRGEYYDAGEAALIDWDKTPAERTGFEPVADRPADTERQQ